MSENIQKRAEKLAARDARRAAQREAAMRPIAVVEPKPKHWVTAVIGAGGTAIWFGLAGWSYTAATVDDMIGAAIILAIAFFVAMGALLASERYGGFANKKRLVINLSVAVGLLIVSVALFFWEYYHRPAPTVTATEIKNLIDNQAKQPGQSQAAQPEGDRKNSPSISAGGNVSIGHIGDIINPTAAPVFKHPPDEVLPGFAVVLAIQIGDILEMRRKYQYAFRSPEGSKLAFGEDRMPVSPTQAA